MITDATEVDTALLLIEEAKSECRKKGQAFDENIPVGIMIETPAAAICADELACKSAFFSIGTNDLQQYTFAVDRGNERVSHLVRSEHPAVLRLIKETIDHAHKRNKTVAMCGEMAGDIKVTPLLVGLGLDEFSMNAQSIPMVKKAIRSYRYDECRKLALKAVRARTADQVKKLLTAFERLCSSDEKAPQA
jgi:phosphotransferase system enzyme I (PtsI)